MQRSELPNDPTGYIVVPRRIGLGILWSTILLIVGGAVTWTKSTSETQAQIDSMSSALNTARSNFTDAIAVFHDRQSTFEERLAANRERLASLEANVSIVVSLTQRIDGKMDAQTEYTRSILEEMRGEIREELDRPRPGRLYAPFGQVPGISQD